MLVTVKGIWGVTHFQEENSGFVPVLLSLLLNWNRAPPHLHSHSLRGETQANDWQSMTCKFIQATMKLATKTCNLFCASYHSRIKSILPCNKSSFCRLHKAVELLTNFCNNFSQPATIWFVARQVWPMGGINRCCWRSRTQQSGDRTFARHLNNGTQYPKFGPVSTYMLFKN